MKQYIRKLCFFFLPIVLFVGSIEFWLYSIGENHSVKYVHQIQSASTQEVNFMRGIISQDYNVYKLEGIKYYNPEILILGSSRVMNFRKEFFNSEEYNFYNAGGLFQSAHDLIEFNNWLKTRPNNQLKLLVIGIDPWWFKKDAIPKSSWLTKDKLIDHALDPKAHIKSFIKVIFSPMKYFGRTKYKQNIGLYARLEEGGFRKDGSKKISRTVMDQFKKNPVFVDREVPPVYERIMKNTTNRFTISEIDSALFEDVMSAVASLNKRYQTIIYLPPFSNQSYDLLKQSRDHEEWWKLNTVHITNKLKEVGVSCIPIEKPDFYSLGDAYFIDGFHPGEVFVARQLLEHGKKQKNLIEKYLNIKNINKMIDSTIYPLFF